MNTNGRIAGQVPKILGRHVDLVGEPETCVLGNLAQELSTISAHRPVEFDGLRLPLEKFSLLRLR